MSWDIFHFKIVSVLRSWLIWKSNIRSNQERDWSCLLSTEEHQLFNYRVMIDWHHPLIRWHHSPDTLTPASQIRKESCKKFCYLTCSLYSQRANHMISKKVARFIKLFKRFRILQEWLKTSDILRDYQVWKKSLLKLFRFWCSSASER
jgi:hypothetical protein